jgi:hypothetical protein
MASIANRTGHSATGANYSSIAHDYIHKWQTLGFALNASPPHATLSYGQNATWGLLYNLFMDRELGLGLVPQSVYDIQDAWYPTVFEKYGVVSLLSPSSFSLSLSLSLFDPVLSFPFLGMVERERESERRKRREAVHRLLI